MGESGKETVKDKLTNIYENGILPIRLTGVGSTSEVEIIDIVSKYPWTASPMRGEYGEQSSNTISFVHNIPYCYVTEHKQIVNSNIANFINTIKVGVDSALNLGDNALETTVRNNTIPESKNLKYVANRAKTINQIKDKDAHDKAYNELLDSEYMLEATTESEKLYGLQGNTGETPIQQAIKGEMPEILKSTDSSNNNKNKNENESLSVKLHKGANKMLTTLKSLRSEYEGYVEKFLENVTSNSLNSDLLNPYRFLYYTNKTKKYYVFPMASPTELLNLNNSYNNDGKGFDVLGIGEFAKGAADMFAGASNLINFFNKTASSITNDKMEEQYLEMAKAFNYNAEGQELTINFPLFNTTIKDSWKTNYRFLVLFLLRNLPFKVSTYSYKPPLLYDIVVPGINHLPLCYVSNISIQHYGLIRHLTCKSIFEEITQVETNKFFYSDIGPITRDIQVPVPEAWFVTIKFKCLLSNTSNLMLDLANVPINIKENEVTLHA